MKPSGFLHFDSLDATPGIQLIFPFSISLADLAIAYRKTAANQVQPRSASIHHGERVHTEDHHPRGGMERGDQEEGEFEDSRYRHGGLPRVLVPHNREDGGKCGQVGLPGRFCSGGV